MVKNVGLKTDYFEGINVPLKSLDIPSSNLVRNTFTPLK